MQKQEINVLTIDLESRSTIDLKKCGMYKYAEDSTTDILCLALKMNDKDTKLWVSPVLDHINHDIESIGYDEIEYMINTADIIEAHNFGFEMCMWHEIMHKRYKFLDLPFKKARCSAAKAATYAIPRSLDFACKALGLFQQKDKAGYNIMMKMCKPRKALKADKKEYPEWEKMTFWHEDPNDFKLLCDYCKQDVEAEHALSAMLLDLNPLEQEVWRLDQKINTRGICIDLFGVKNIMQKVKEKEAALLLEVQELTLGKINSVRQIAATLTWLKDNGIEMENLQKATVEDKLTENLPEKAKRLLVIRQSLGKSSVSKFETMVKWTCKDGRARGTFMYHGASTGRFSGRGIQPHNYPRDSLDAKNIDSIISLDTLTIEILYDCVMQTASKCLRGMLVAGKGNQLFCSDYSAIEAVVLAWIAGETKTLHAFRNNLDVYKVAAMDFYNVKYDEISSMQRQVGKTAVLALGYQGGVNAFMSMAKTYGVELEEEKVKEIIKSWREANPNIVRFWKGVELAAYKTVKTRKVNSFGRIKFGIRGRFLHCRLPSGRLLSYCDPHLKLAKTQWGEEKTVIGFMGTNATTKKWERQTTYGGKLTENIVQAIARDLLVEAMLRVEANGYPVVMHCHDEIVAERKIGEGSLEEFDQLLIKRPSWGQDIPIKANGWVGYRYRK